MIDRLEVLARRLRRRISRSEWLIRLLRLPVGEGTGNDPGLLMIQIDGLSREELERALTAGGMPFLKRLLQRQHYRLHTHYSGLPSSTPAVQGELFYGERCAVPAFSFYSRKFKRVFRMFSAQDTVLVEARLKRAGKGLLEGGSAYSDVYTGGASEAHFCGPTLGLNGMFRRGSPFALPMLFALNIWSFIRTGALLCVEFGMALADCMRGLIDGQDLWMELKFVPARVAICVLARELETIGATIDVQRGLPVVHLNLLGYDEQSHRRGPSSAFAHWGLRGIDDSIKRLWRAAHRSARRQYDVWVYSDHGQEETIPFGKETGKTVHEVVMQAFDEAAHAGPVHGEEKRGEQSQRFWSLGLWLPRRLLPETPSRPGVPAHHPVVTAMGPIGHVYPPEPLSEEQLASFARRLVDEGIPLVLRAEGEDEAPAWTPEGELLLPDDAAGLLGEDHPFLNEVALDLTRLVHHPDAGALVIGGWRRGRKPITFPNENGSHAGPGPRETAGFALLPADSPLPEERDYLRPMDLREGALAVLGRAPRRAPANSRHSAPGSIRLMTYNVHSCIGMDGRHSPQRIARLIAQYDPDVVALQELDVGRRRTRGVDQAHAIARALEMEHQFHAVLRVAEEQYGDAILSRLPMKLVRAGPLPLPGFRSRREPRGALWVNVAVEGAQLQIINTHLGLRPVERRGQVAALLDGEWLGHPACREPVILCGDLNSTPRSYVCRALSRRLVDAQRSLLEHRPRNTWFGRYPLGRIDHVFASSDLEVVRVQVAATDLARIASDHLPLIVDLRIRG